MRLRPATIADSAFLYRVRNDPEVRRWSRNQDAFGEAQHATWLAAALVDPHVRIWIGVWKDLDIGYAKLVEAGGVARMSVALDQHRMTYDRGLGTELITAVVIETLRHGTHLLAQVRGNNAASLIAFLKNRFIVFDVEQPNTEYAMVHLVREPTIADAPRICDGCREGWPHRRHPLDRISSRWTSDAERDAEMATWPVRYDLHEESVGDGQVLVHECAAARLFDRSLA